MHPGINSVSAFREYNYVSMWSINFSEKGSLFTVSGLDTEQTPASIEWIVSSSAFNPAGGLAGN
jgi:hypothetical protein